MPVPRLRTTLPIIIKTLSELSARVQTSFTDASVRRQQNGQGAASRDEHVQPGAGLRGHRGSVHRHHGADIRVQLDHLLLRVLAVQWVRETPDGWRPQGRDGRVLQPDAVLRERADAAGGHSVREPAAVQRDRRVPVVAQRRGAGVPVELHRARVRVDSHVVRADAEALLAVRPTPVPGVRPGRRWRRVVRRSRGPESAHAGGDPGCDVLADREDGQADRHVRGGAGRGRLRARQFIR